MSERCNRCLRIGCRGDDECIPVVEKAMTDPAEQKARELLEGLTAINQHMGYQFTQPLMEATSRIAAALREEQDNYEQFRGYYDKSMQYAKEIDALKAELERRQEAEASVCPEDVGAVEYINALKAEIARLKGELNGRHS